MGPLDSIEDIETPDDYVKKSERNDMKQHAVKIIQGIKKLDEKDANRAIWELFQNAVDLSSHCEITINVTDDYFQFTHNGTPFTPMTLDCLFKQMSSKTLAEKKLEYEETDPIGQYGTGFMTTHAFGKEVILTGSLRKRQGYVPIEKFIIDRNTENWEILADRISDMKKSVSAMLGIDGTVETTYNVTTFCYHTTSSQNKQYVDKALKSLLIILPYVFTLNSRLQKVSVFNKDTEPIIYKKLTDDQEENGIKYTEVLINEISKKVYYLTSNDNKVTVILPLSDPKTVIEFPPDLPKLYLFYPLIGTESFGINYLLNSRHFQPTEPRDALYLGSGNTDNLTEETANRSLIEKASELIFEYIRNNIAHLANPLFLARVNFDVLGGAEPLNKYFTELKEIWLKELGVVKLVEAQNENLSAQEATFWSEELLKDPLAFEAIYYFVAQHFPNSPKKHVVKEWGHIISEWKLDALEMVTIEKIAEHLHNTTIELAGNKEYLKTFCEYVVAQGQSLLFATKAVIPNINGNFRTLSNLRKPLNISDSLLSIAKNLIPESANKLIHDDFKLELGLDVFKRKTLEAEINNAVTPLETKAGSSLDRGFLESLIDYCKIETTADADNVPGKFVKLIARYYKHSETPLLIDAIKEDEIDIRTTQKKLLRIFLNDVSAEGKEWVKENVFFLKEMLNLGVTYSEYKDIFKTAAVFPNKLNELCESGKLFIDGGIDDRLIFIYDRVVISDKSILATLINDEFKNLAENIEPRTPLLIAGAIEEALATDGQFNNIIDHPFKEEILEIMKKASEGGIWHNLFRTIGPKRANMMIDMMDGDKVKENIYSIVVLPPDQIELLGSLAKHEQMADIISLGTEALNRRDELEADFQHKKYIGNHIEKVIRQKLQLLKAEDLKIVDQQDGQDIIVYIKATPVYYIEVKSRWSNQNPVRMSKNQTIAAFNNRDKYSLCTVDMSRYDGPEDKYKITNIELIRDLIWFNNDIGINVEHLQEVLEMSTDTETIRIDGEIRTHVPMSYITGGKNLYEFEDIILEKINKHINSLVDNQETEPI